MPDEASFPEGACSAGGGTYCFKAFFSLPGFRFPVVLRDTYDRFGEEGLKRTEQGGSADPFGDMFSHFGFGGGRRQREESRTPNVEVICGQGPRRVVMCVHYLSSASTALDNDYLASIMVKEVRAASNEGASPNPPSPHSVLTRLCGSQLYKLCWVVCQLLSHASKADFSLYPPNLLRRCLQIPLRVSLRQLYEGDTFDTVYVRQAMCVGAGQCEKNCKDCQGPGIAVRMHQLGPGFVQQVQVCRRADQASGCGCDSRVMSSSSWAMPPPVFLSLVEFFATAARGVFSKRGLSFYLRGSDSQGLPFEIRGEMYK